MNLKFKSISLSANTGFAYAVNRGIEASVYEYVCVCNNDLTVHQTWFKNITSTISSNKNSKITTFFGLVLNKDGTKVESRGLKFYPYGKAENIDNGQAYSLPVIASAARQSHPYLIWGASASIVVYHKLTLLKVGLFDERFFAYIEDVDLSYRLNKSGYKTLFVPDAKSFHLGGGTAGKNSFLRKKLTFINWLKFLKKNYATNELLINLPGIILERFRLLFSFFL
jgi:GT2 family glycosyltransferase